MSGPTVLRRCLLPMALLLSACDFQEEPQRIVGQLESDRVEIAAQFAEPIVTRPVAEGQVVTAGTLLATQDPARIESRIAEAAAAEARAQARLDELVRGPRAERIVQARASLQGARDELQFRETDLVRAETVYQQNLASTELRDRARVARDAARANVAFLESQLEELETGTTAEELRQAEEALREAKARIASLEVDLQRHSSFAPVDGVLDSWLFETGERPSVGQPIAVMLPGTQPYARVYVPESIRARVTAGTAARVFVDGLAEPVDGRVRWVSSEAAFTPYFALTEHDRGRLSFVAKIDLLNRAKRLPEGVPVEVELALGQDAEAP